MSDPLWQVQALTGIGIPLGPLEAIVSNGAANAAQEYAERHAIEADAFVRVREVVHTPEVEFRWDGKLVKRTDFIPTETQGGQYGAR